MKNKTLLFVYGTLKQGFGNHHYLDSSSVKLLGTHETEPKFTMLSMGGFPAVLCEGNTSIKGELYEVRNKEVLADVYSLEGYSGEKGNPANWYDVETIETPHGTASMFVFRRELKNYSTKHIVESGKW